MKDRTDKIGKIIISALMLLCVGIMLGACGNRGTEPQSQTAEETERLELCRKAECRDTWFGVFKLKMA